KALLALHSSQLIGANSSSLYHPLVWMLAALTVVSSKHATVIGPTPPGTGVMNPASLLTFSKSTSPRSFPSTRVRPTSTTAALGLTCSSLIWKLSRPTALTRMSAVFVIWVRLGVFEWHIVMVASLLRNRFARGLPTRVVRLMMTRSEEHT